MDKIELGKVIVKENPFYNTLFMLLQCYFTRNHDMYFVHLLRSITNKEDEFKVFMVYKDYAMKLYTDEHMESNYSNLIDRLYALIALIKTNYDSNHKVIQPFINSVSTNPKILQQFNAIKNSYIIRDYVKYEKISRIIQIMQEASEYDKKASELYNSGLDLLFQLVGEYKTDVGLLRLE